QRTRPAARMTAIVRRRTFDPTDIAPFYAPRGRHLRGDDRESGGLLGQGGELGLDLLPGGHQLLGLGGQALLLLFELAHLVAGSAVEEGRIAEELVDRVDPGLGLLDRRGELVAAAGELALALLAPAAVQGRRRGAGGGLLLLLAAEAQDGVGVE